jgi:hypothetical protein
MNKKRLILKIVIFLLIMLSLIQFIPAAKSNLDKKITDVHIESTIEIPRETAAILNRSCYDCHSNYTNYPWYYRIQPVGWWLKRHIDAGKKHLNFSEFGLIPQHDLSEVFEEIGASVSEGWMPLGSYLWIHKNAALTEAEVNLVKDWAAKEVEKQEK